MVSSDVDERMLEIMRRLSGDWSAVSLAALTTLLSSFIIRAALSAVMVSCEVTFKLLSCE